MHYVFGVTCPKLVKMNTSLQERPKYKKSNQEISKPLKKPLVVWIVCLSTAQFTNKK